ncbi:hypothetical protein [Deinococcus apachensis]|uniref:hypothetical protein n=1 Tax=Deinococcus apachensis TaxID=309886 RepID=UPI0003775D81|nr:hypothetical protein [Deinococcus apachensis]
MQVLAFRLQPQLELGEALGPHTLQQRPAVQVQRPGPVPGRAGPAKAAHVEGRGPAQPVAARVQAAAPGESPNTVQQVSQSVARRARLDTGVEQLHDLVPRHPLARAGEVGEEPQGGLVR